MYVNESKTIIMIEKISCPIIVMKGADFSFKLDLERLENIYALTSPTGKHGSFGNCPSWLHEATIFTIDLLTIHYNLIVHITCDIAVHVCEMTIVIKL